MLWGELVCRFLQWARHRRCILSHTWNTLSHIVTNRHTSAPSKHLNTYIPALLLGIRTNCKKCLKGGSFINTLFLTKAHLSWMPYCRNMDVASSPARIDCTIKIERHSLLMFFSVSPGFTGWRPMVGMFPLTSSAFSFPSSLYLYLTDVESHGRSLFSYASNQNKEFEANVSSVFWFLIAFWSSTYNQLYVTMDRQQQWIQRFCSFTKTFKVLPKLLKFYQNF